MRPAKKPLQERLADIERRLDVLESDRRPAPSTSAPHTQPPPLAPQTQSPPPLAPEAFQPPALPPDRVRQPLDLERVFRWSGAVLLVLAATFLLSVALDRGWLTPAVRLVGGIGLGVVLAGLGVRARPRSDAFATTLLATGALITYLMVWAGLELYGLLGPWTAGIGMLVVVGGLFAEVLRSDDVALASLATLGGFAVPFLVVAAGEDLTAGGSAGAILVYLVVLLVLTSAVHLAVGWRILQVVAAGTAVLAGLLVLFSATPTDPFDVDAIGLSAYFALVAVAFWAVPAAFRPDIERRRARRLPVHVISRAVDDALGIPVRLAGFPLLLILLGVIGSLWELEATEAGLVALLMAGLAAVIATISSDLDDVVNWLLAAALVAVGLVLLLDEDFHGVALLAEGTAVLVAARYANGHPANRVTGHVLGGIGAAIAILGLLADFGEPGWGPPLVAGIVVALLAAGGWLVEGRARAGWWGAAYVGAMLLARHVLGDGDVGIGIATGLWALVGLVVLLVGRRLGQGPIEVGGWATLGVVAVRLVDHLGDLEPLVRVAVFLVIGVVFLVGGWFARTDRPRTEEEPVDEDHPVGV
ncbi:MAG: DUF2339 domain-containing protein [Acidimicrobiia bacterium]|nr:DUF2339 domain-containing protein [Acidimicrobiia bacterium]